MVTLTRTKKPDPATLYLALTSAITKAGTMLEGQKLRGDHPLVTTTPAFWIAADSADDEIYAARKALMYPTRDPDPEMPPISSDGTPLVVAGPPTDPSRHVVALVNVPPTGRYAPIAAGALVSAASPVVRARPKSFRPATLADLPGSK